MFNIIKDFNSIDTAADLKKRGLTPADYAALREVLKDLLYNGEADYLQENIKNYLQRYIIKTEKTASGYKSRA
jgi:hypothetical protein